MPPIKFIFLTIVILILIYVCYGVARFFNLAKKGKAFSAKTTPYEQHPLHPGLRILVVGDSTGVGSGAENNTLSIAGRFGTEYPNAEIINLSVNGLRMKGLREILEARKNNLGKFDMVLIQAGGNDILHFTPLSDFRKDLHQVFVIAKELSPQVIALHTGNVGLAPIFPPWATPVFAWRTRGVRSVYEVVAAQDGVVYVDLYTKSRTDPRRPDSNDNYAADFLHLNGKGYGMWYKEIQDAIQARGIRL